MSQVISSALTLMRRMPPDQLEKCLAGLSKLVPDEEAVEEVTQRVDKAIQIGTCTQTGYSYIKCEFNKDMDSHRSPWSNLYDPPIQGLTPSDTLRGLQVKAQQIFQQYVRLYYNFGVSSVYFWDTDPSEFACSFLIKKDLDPTEQFKGGGWESTNLITVKLNSATGKVVYSITSSVYLVLKVEDPSVGEVNLSGSLSRNMADEKSLGEDHYGEYHIYNMITLVENMESQLRTSLDEVYIGKTQEILDRTRILEENRNRGFKMPF